MVHAYVHGAFSGKLDGIRHEITAYLDNALAVTHYHCVIACKCSFYRNVLNRCQWLILCHESTKHVLYTEWHHIHFILASIKTVITQ